MSAVPSTCTEHQLLLAVKCGGHSYARQVDLRGGMQIDLSRFRAARVDPLSRTALRRPAAACWANSIHEAMALGS